MGSGTLSGSWLICVLALVAGMVDCGRAEIGSENGGREVLERTRIITPKDYTDDMKIDLFVNHFYIMVELESAPYRVELTKGLSPNNPAVLVQSNHGTLRGEAEKLLAMLQDAPVEKADYAEMKEVLEAAIQADDAFAASRGGDESSKDVGYWEERIAAFRAVLLRCRKFDKSYYDSMVPSEEFMKKLEESRMRMSNAGKKETQTTAPTNTPALPSNREAVLPAGQTNADAASDKIMEAPTNTVSPPTAENHAPPERNASFPKPLLALLGLGCLGVLGWYAARKR